MQYHKILLINGKTEHFLCINVTEYKNINKIYTLIIYYKKTSSTENNKKKKIRNVDTINQIV